MSALKTIVILGGDMAGPMAAALLARSLPASHYKIIFIQGDETVGRPEWYGQAHPELKTLHKTLKMSEVEFCKKTCAAIHLGQEFIDWNGDTFIQNTTPYGPPINGIDYFQFALQTSDLPALEAGNMAAFAARSGRFSPHPDMEYGYSIEPELYADLLIERAETFGAKIVTSPMATAHHEDGRLTHLTLRDGSVISGNFFIDASGMKTNLADDRDYQSWSQHLPGDHYTVQSREPSKAPALLSCNTAKDNGWSLAWETQKQGHKLQIFSSQYGDMADIEGRLVRFMSGRRTRAWQKNVLSLGLAQASFAPLTGHNLYLIYQDLQRFLSLLPGDFSSPHEALEYNKKTGAVYDYYRDFQCANYALARPEKMQSIEIPVTLKRRLETFKSCGYFTAYDGDIIDKNLWVNTMLGLGHWPKRAGAMAGIISPDTARDRWENHSADIAKTISAMPPHADFIAAHIKASCADKGHSHD